MQIERVTMHHLRMTLRTPFETSFGRIATRDCILLEINSEGLTAFGECVADRDPLYSYENAGTAWHILENYLIPAILGQPVQDAADFMQRVEFVRGHNLAKAGLEMALLDLQGKRSGKSLRSLLGGVHEKVNVGVSIGIKDSPEALVEAAAAYIERGYRRVKIKIKPGRDVAETQAMRQAFPELALQVDANSAYTLASAEAIKPLDELNLLLIEQPLAEDDLWDHSRLQSQFSTPLCLDESIISPRHARQALEMAACRVINIKAGRVGGLLASLAIHDLCHAQGVPVWCGGMLETGVGRASNLALASLPNFTLPGDISASARYYVEDITDQQFVLNADSTIQVPDQPGLGITIHAAARQRATLKSLSLPA